MDQAYNCVMITTAGLDRPGPAIVYVNRAFCIMTGYTPEELIGATSRILQGPRTDPSVLQRLRRMLSAGEAFQASTFNYRKDGTPYLVEWNSAPYGTRRGAWSTSSRCSGTSLPAPRRSSSARRCSTASGRRFRHQRRGGVHLRQSGRLATAWLRP
ncbi:MULTISPECIES: PAS domain S-box protein [Halomonadaceae]